MLLRKEEATSGFDERWVRDERAGCSESPCPARGCSFDLCRGIHEPETIIIQRIDLDVSCDDAERDDRSKLMPRNSSGIGNMKIQNASLVTPECSFCIKRNERTVALRSPLRWEAWSVSCWTPARPGLWLHDSRTREANRCAQPLVCGAAA